MRKRTQVTQEMIDRLPMWARILINDLQREKEVSIRALRDTLDQQTPSPVYYDDLKCLGEKQGPSSLRQYVQTHKITMFHDGVEVTLYASDRGGVKVSFCGERSIPNGVLIPEARNLIRIVSEKSIALEARRRRAKQ